MRVRALTPWLQHPLPFALACATLSIGMAAALSVFVALDGVFNPGFRIPEPDKVLLIREKSPIEGPEPLLLSPERYDSLARAANDIIDIGAVLENPTEILISHDGVLENIRATSASDRALAVLGGVPVLGRFSKSANEVVISHRFWRQRLGGKPTVIGTTMVIEGGTPVTVVGVMPEAFAFPDGVDVWGWWSPALTRGEIRSRRGLLVFARLRGGVTRSDAWHALNRARETAPAGSSARDEAETTIVIEPIRRATTHAERTTIRMLSALASVSAAAAGYLLWHAAGLGGGWALIAGPIPAFRGLPLSTPAVGCNRPLEHAVAGYLSISRRRTGE